MNLEMQFTVRSTGKKLHDDELHLWTFGEDGKVIALRHFADTAKHIEANRRSFR